MPTFTTNSGLIRPDLDAFYDVEVTNENIDIIDGDLYRISDDS
jgi:hypothetical protein